MNAQHPDDFAPLSYGAAMAVGLLLILGLPTEFESTRREDRTPRGPDSGSRAPVALARKTPVPTYAVEAHALRAASRP